MMQPAEPVQITERRVPMIEPDGLGFIWETGKRNLIFHADRITPYFGPNDLQAEIRVMVGERFVHMSNYVITNPKHRESLAQTLFKHPTLKKWDLFGQDGWFELVEQFCTGVQLKQRSRIQVNVTAPAPKKMMQYLVENLVIKGRRPNLIFAPGGSGKSYLVLAMCVAMIAKRGIGDLTVMGGSVPGYFDWEDDFDIFNDRANTVARGFGVDVPPIHHFKMMGGTISDQINEMAKLIQEYGINFAVIDSMSAAAGTVGHGQDWGAIAQKVFDALALVPDVTWLIIGHVTKEFLKEPSGAMLGSIQIMNRSSNAFEIRSEQEPDSRTVHLKLHDAKWNHTGKRSTIGLSMQFQDDAVTFESESSETVPSNLVDRMTYALMGGAAMSAKELSEKLGALPGSIRNAKYKNKNRFIDDSNGLIRLNPEWSGGGSVLDAPSIEVTNGEPPDYEQDQVW